MSISLNSLWPIERLKDYKIHFARWNKKVQPLEVFARDREEWQGWQEYMPGRDDFNRPFIFSLIQFYHEPDTWLFGGVYQVIARHNNRYEVDLTTQHDAMIGRLKIFYPYRQRATRTLMESHYKNFIVKEILGEQYTGRNFPGFDQIKLSFLELDTLARNGRIDWQTALSNIKGVYLITDTLSGKQYIGSAYGDQGIWSRWREYLETGHGNNVELIRLVQNKGIAYCRDNFCFALLEQLTARTADEVVISRESFWKNVLLTRGENGLNKN